VGSLEPGKNLKLLKEAYLLAEMKNRRLPPLLIVGARWQGVATEGAQPRGWHYLGRQPDEVLLYLYRHALALLFPSIYEGFGFPVIEAMAQGCPVVCSPTSSLPEVAGDAAMMVPLTASHYVDAMRALMKKPDVRAGLISRGREQARKFTWRRCAEETVAVYHKVMSR
jgi:alpha-1,3-rhamnosyl/mannosyltransferase